MNGFTQSYNRHISRIEKILAHRQFDYLDVSKLKHTVFITSRKGDMVLRIIICCEDPFGKTGYMVRGGSETSEERLLYEGSSWEETIRRIKRFAPEKAA